jgi:hypothetical protein
MKMKQKEIKISKSDLKKLELRGEQVMRGEERRERKDARRFERDTDKGF